MAADSSGSAELLCFNRHYLKKLLVIDQEYIVFAQFEVSSYQKLQTAQFEFLPASKASDSLDFLRIVPIYRLTKGISQSAFRKIMYSALKSAHVPESLPDYLIQKHKLPLQSSRSFSNPLPKKPFPPPPIHFSIQIL